MQIRKSKTILTVSLINAVVVSIFFIANFSQNTWAYPNFISMGYGSCMACHYNPLGNGPLNEYGRALGSNEISSRLLIPKSVSDEELSDRSGFFFGPSPVPALRPYAGYRSLAMASKSEASSTETDFIIMDLHAGLTVSPYAGDRFIASGQIAYAPVPRALKGQPDVKIYRSREHYLGWRFSRELGFYAGLMDKAFGIRTPNHTSLSRVYTWNTQNDQTHGVLLHYLHSKFELGVQPFIGNLVQSSDLRQEGVTMTGEYSLSQTSRVGASLLYSQSEYRSAQMVSLHSRIGLGWGHSILAEMGRVSLHGISAKSPSNLNAEKSYLTTEGHARVSRGVFAILLAEGGVPKFGDDSMIYRLGPGLQYFMVPRFEMRLDVASSFAGSSSDFENTRNDLMLQAHLWF